MTGQSFLILLLRDAIQLSGDVKEPPVEALESAACLLIGESTTVHFKKMACGGQRLMYAGEAGAGGAVGNGENWCLMWMGRVLTGGVELTL